jgi:hypothetical protein
MAVFDTLNILPITLITEKTLSANNTTQNINLVKLSGAVRILKLYAIFTNEATLTNMTDCHWDLWDSTASVPITKATTLTLSTAIVGSVVGKTAGAASNAAFSAGTVGAIAEGATPPLTYEFAVLAKSGANTYIRWNYTTTDAPIAAKMKFYIEYRPIGDGYLTII